MALLSGQLDIPGRCRWFHQSQCVAVEAVMLQGLLKAGVAR